jgi:hypothetical protein
VPHPGLQARFVECSIPCLRKRQEISNRKSKRHLLSELDENVGLRCSCCFLFPLARHGFARSPSEGHWRWNGAHQNIRPLWPSAVGDASVVMRCLATRWPSAGGRTECAPPEKRAFAWFSAFPVTSSAMDRAALWRGGLCTPAGETLLPPGNRLIRPPGVRLAPDDHVMPRHGHGLATRTRRAHPSEKTTLRVMPGFSPLGHPSLDSPPLEGRAPHARNVGITPTRMWRFLASMLSPMTR